MSDPTALPLFVALEPDAGTIERIWRYKRQTESLVGPQLYLDHPPHMTLYVGVFPDFDAVLEATRTLAASWIAPELTLDGWQTFLGDALTGNNTLTLKFAEADCERLRGLQRQLVETLAPLRDVAATERRIGGRMSSLAESEQRDARQFGFPYVGAGWKPHLTVASIRAEDWASVAEKLLRESPAGTVSCPRLQVYRLVDEHPELVESIALAAEPDRRDLKEEILAALWRVADRTDWVLSATVAGSFLTRATLEAVSDIDVIAVVDRLDGPRFTETERRFAEELRPVVERAGLSLRVNSTLGPRKFNEPDIAVLHLMLYSPETHRLHAIRSPFTCLDWQRSTTIRKRSLASVYPVFGLQPRHFLSARRGPKDYLRDFDRGVVSYRELVCSETACEELLREQPMTVRDRYEYAYHVQRFLMQNLLKLLRRENSPPADAELLDQFFRVFPRKADGYADLYRTLRDRKERQDFAQPIAGLDERLRGFVADFEVQFRGIFLETARRHVVFRHAATALNGGTGDQRRFVGRTDPDVSPIPDEALSLLASALAEQPVSAVYTSPLRRCRQSVEALSRRRTLPAAAADARLVEIDYGLCEGRTIADARREHGELFAAWGRGEDPPFPGGESTADVVERLHGFANDVWDRAEGNTVACTHNVVVRALAGEALGVPRGDWHRIQVPHLAPVTLIQTREYGRFLDLDEGVEERLFADFLDESSAE